MKKLLNKISPTAIAIFIVGGAMVAGGATAAVQGTINGKQIKRNTVTSKQIKDHTLVRADINAKTWKQLKGETGKRGKRGLIGPIGPIGPKGEAGVNGAAGSDGARGEPGATGPEGAVGPTGHDGADGADGATGDTGPQGVVGPTGATGVAGTDGEDGAAGPQGDVGPTGATGAAGSVEYVGVNWGVDYRNTIGSPVAQLRGGPGVTPYGIGSLGLEVAKVGTEKERVAFSNEVDFAGDNVADLTEVGFQVYTTGENSDVGYNMPNIAIEIDPNGADGTTASYSTLLFNPDGGSTDRNSEPNVWSPYLDGTTSGTWGLTGSQFNTPPSTECGYNYGGCTFDELQALLATGDGAKIISVGVSKGRDNAWLGAVDGLRINGDVYDFEPFGVTAVPAE